MHEQFDQERAPSHPGLVCLGAEAGSAYRFTSGWLEAGPGLAYSVPGAPLRQPLLQGIGAPGGMAFARSTALLQASGLTLSRVWALRGAGRSPQKLFFLIGIVAT